MEIDVFPQKKYTGAGKAENLAIRITLNVEAKTKNDKKILRELWESVEGEEDATKLVEVIKKFSNIKKQDEVAELLNDYIRV